MNEESIASTTEELTQDQWWLILWSLLTDVPEKEWNEFAHDLIYKDRFSSSHKVVGVIKDFSEKCTATIKKGQVLYRARVYRKDPLQEFLSDVFKNPDAKKSSRPKREFVFFSSICESVFHTPHLIIIQIYVSHNITSLLQKIKLFSIEVIR